MSLPPDTTRPSTTDPAVKAAASPPVPDPAPRISESSGAGLGPAVLARLRRDAPQLHGRQEAMLRLALAATGRSCALIAWVDGMHWRPQVSVGMSTPADMPLSRTPFGIAQAKHREAKSAQEQDRGGVLELVDLGEVPALADTLCTQPFRSWRSYAAVALYLNEHLVATVEVAGPTPGTLDALAVQALVDLTQALRGQLEDHWQLQQARLREARVRAAGAAGSDWFWETDAQGHLTWVSENSESRLGLSTDRQIGFQLEDLVTPAFGAHAASWDRFLAAVRARQPYRDLVVRRETPQGVLTLSINGTPVFDSHGVFQGYRGAARNITREVEAQTEARRAERLLRDAIEGFGGAVMLLDETSHVVMANRRWLDRCGAYLAGSGGHWPTLVRAMVTAGEFPQAQSDPESFIRWHTQRAEPGGTLSRELRHRDGWWLVTEQGLHDGGCLHLQLDITDRKNAERALAQREAQLRDSQASMAAVLKALPDLWFVFDAQGRYLECGAPDPALQMQPGQELIGRSPADVLPSLVAERIAGAVQAALREGTTQSLEYELVLADERRRILESRFSRMADQRVLMIVRDATEQRAAQQALRDKQAAELASQAKTEFLSRMSHEMRTPLNAVLGFAQLLWGPSSERPEEVRSQASHLMAAGQHLMALIDDVLDLQRVETGQLSMNLEAVPLQTVVQEAMTMLYPMATHAQVTWLEDLPGPVQLLADRLRLRQVLVNVGSNAIKYNQPGGTVRLNAIDDVDAERVRITVQDDGQGIASERMPRLFQPFDRLGQETSPIPGTGLGLVIAHRMVQEMGGRIDIDSQLGVGTRVVIDLPRASAHAHTPPHNPAQAALPRAAAPDDGSARDQRLAGDMLQMLYVEDNPVNAMLFEAIADQTAWLSLRVVNDGAHALQTLAHWSPDIIVLDAHLPGLPGMTVYERLREQERFKNTPVFMCSADASPADLQRAERAGFAGYWTKPIDVQRVLADLERLRRGPARA